MDAGTASSVSSIGQTATSVAGLGGLLAKSGGQYIQGKAQSQSDSYNAAVQVNNATIATENATLTAQEGEANVGTQELKNRAEMGSIKASQAANGIDVNSRSAVDVRGTAAEVGTLNALAIRSNAARQAYGFQTQAVSDTAQSKLDTQAAGYASEAGNINAMGTLLSGAASGAQNGLWNGFIGANSLNSTTNAPTTEGPYYMGDIGT